MILVAHLFLWINPERAYYSSIQQRYFSSMFEKIKKNKLFRIGSNKYLLTGLPFLIWMLFFDANSFLMQQELGTEIDKLQQSIEFYEGELAVDREELYELENNSMAFEKYAREKFWMHKKGEELYVFEYQTD